MRHNRALTVLKFAVFAVAFSFLMGWVVMMLWNWLIPAIFGWHRIGYLQAWGLFLLSKILLGGFHGWGGGHRSHWRHRMKERWESMTPEEREKFKERMRGGCGPFRQSAEPRRGSEQFRPEQS